MEHLPCPATNLPELQLLDNSGWPDNACAECIYILDGMKLLKSSILESHRILYQAINGTAPPMEGPSPKGEEKKVSPKQESGNGEDDEADDVKPLIPCVVMSDPDEKPTTKIGENDASDVDIKDKKCNDDKKHKKKKKNINNKKKRKRNSTESSSDDDDLEQSEGEDQLPKKRVIQADEDKLEEAMLTMDLLKCHECNRSSDTLKDLFEHFRQEHQNPKGYIF